MAHTVENIATSLGAEAFGDVSILVRGAAEPAMAGPDDLALALSPAFAAGLSEGQARVAVVWPGADWQGMGLEAAIVAPQARLAMARLTGMLEPGDGFAPDIHPMAVVEDGAQIGADCWIGPFTHIRAGARIGDGARIGSNVFIGAEARIGQGAVIHPGARIMARVVAGDGLVVQPGAVIGADGFSFSNDGASNPERAKATGGAERLTPPDSPNWHKTMSLGAVVLGDDVEIGANSTVDAGTIRPTRIGNGTKLDNLVHVGHNVVIGDHCLLCGQTGIAGSVEIGDRVVLGGQTGVGDHHRIGDDVVTGAGTMILSNVVSGSVLLGYPAQRMDRSIAAYKALRRLSRG